MGFLDALKGLIPKNEPLPWDPQSIRHPAFTLRLPEGWRFTQADWRRALATGPSAQAVELYYSIRLDGAPKSSEEIERMRPHMLQLMAMLVKHDAKMKSTPRQSVLTNGVLWTEASEVRGEADRFVFYTTHLQPKTAQNPPRMLQLTLQTSVPVSSGALGAERLETLRDVLRKVEWR